MTLKIKYCGNVYRLVECDESEQFPCGIMFVRDGNPRSRPGTPEEDRTLWGLNSFLNVKTSSQCGEPSRPDAVSVAHGMCEDAEDIEVLEYEGREHPAGTVF